MCAALLLLGAATAATAATAAASATSDSLDSVLNGWYPCAVEDQYGFASEAIVPFECAEMRVPLCYEGICESDKTIDLFLRRLLATNPDQNARPKALWFLQGGPGGSSYAMDSYIEYIDNTANGTVDLYTMDHRGTGRSFFLDCQAAQALAEDSIGGSNIVMDEMPNCFKDILFQIDGHLEAFSITSAAKDMEFLVDQLHTEDEDVFIYGVSYGTLLTERIMHLAPPKIRGYILDGVEREDSPSFAETNPGRLAPGDRLAQYCQEDELCSSYFVNELEQYGNLTAVWMALYDRLDNAEIGENACVDLINEADSSIYPSDYLRDVFDGTYITDIMMRTLVPAIFYRLNRCADYDITFLRVALDIPEASSSSTSGSEERRRLEPFNPITDTSPILHWLVKMSEMWSYPSPSWDDDFAVYLSGVFTTDMTLEFQWFCMMTGNFSSPACSNVVESYPDVDFSAWDAPPFLYERDEYFQQFATIPEDASVVLFNGLLDFQTPSESGEHEYENIIGDDKMLVAFQYGVHGTGIQRTTTDDDSNCGASIIANFVQVGGDLDAVDISCMELLPTISFNDSLAISAYFPGLVDVYDGEMPDESSSIQEKRSHHQRVKRYSYHF